MGIKKLSKNLPFFIIAYFCLSPVPAVASEQPYNECVFLSQGAINISNELAAAMLLVSEDTRLAKTAGKYLRDARVTIKNLQDYSNLPCDTVSELNWPAIRSERQKMYFRDIGKATTLIGYFTTFKVTEIKCYNPKTGVYKNVKGVKPKCPYRFQVL